MSELVTHDPAPAEVAHLDPTGGRLVAWAKAASAANSLARALVQTAFVPKQFQGNAADATAAIILGDELGLSPISALRSIYVIGGQPALYARTMVALVLAHGHRIWTVEDSPSKVTVAGQRRGTDRVEQVAWTIDRAKKAGYTSNRKYDSDPQAMLWARAAGDVARRIAPDVLAGCPATVEEIELEASPTTTVVREPGEKRTVTRQRKEPTPAPEPEEPPLEEPEPPMTAAQQRHMHALLHDLGVEDRDQRLRLVSDVLGREVATSKELTTGEASVVIDELKARATEQHPEPVEWEQEAER